MKGIGGALLLLVVGVAGVALVGVGWATDSGRAILTGAALGIGGYVLSGLAQVEVVRLLFLSERRRRIASCAGLAGAAGALVGLSGVLPVSVSLFCGSLGGAVAVACALALGRWVRFPPDGYAWAWVEQAGRRSLVVVPAVPPKRPGLGERRFPV
jgi:hypothetical protein